MLLDVQDDIQADAIHQAEGRDGQIRELLRSPADPA